MVLLNRKMELKMSFVLNEIIKAKPESKRLWAPKK